MKGQCLKCQKYNDLDFNGLCTSCRSEEKLIEKIKKLLALSKSPNEAEAELAAQRAHELLTKYNLSMDYIQEKEIREGNVITGRSLKKWRHLLINGIASYYYCKSLCYVRGSGYYRIVFIGQKHNIIICKSMYDYLEKAVIRESKNIHKNAKSKYRENFKLGMVIRIAERLSELSKSKTTVEEKALVVTENSLIVKYLADKNTFSEQIDFDPENINAYLKGKIAGNKVSLSSQVNNDSRKTQILNHGGV